MHKELESSKISLSDRIYELYLEKYDGNNSSFAKACNCHEKTIRKIFSKEQGLTVNLLVKICFALKISPSELLKGLELKD